MLYFFLNTENYKRDVFLRSDEKYRNYCLKKS
jgi:hypothetical protein